MHQNEENSDVLEFLRCTCSIMNHTKLYVTCSAEETFCALDTPKMTVVCLVPPRPPSSYRRRNKSWVSCWGVTSVSGSPPPPRRHRRRWRAKLLQEQRERGNKTDRNQGGGGPVAPGLGLPSSVLPRAPSASRLPWPCRGCLLGWFRFDAGGPTVAKAAL